MGGKGGIKACPWCVNKWVAHRPIWTRMGRGQGELHNDDINATVNAIAVAICINAQGRSTSTGPDSSWGAGKANSITMT